MANHNCDHLVDELIILMDDQQPSEIRNAVLEQIMKCPNCSALVATLGKTIELYHDLPAPDLPEDARRRIFHSLGLDNYLEQG